jgi:type II secretory pathway component PulF
MPTFSYQAINEAGATVSGEIEAESLQTANSLLASDVSSSGTLLPDQSTRTDSFYQTV